MRSLVEQTLNVGGRKHMQEMKRRDTFRPEPILFTIPNFITAGSGRAMLNIIERLDKERFAPVVCVARKGGELDAEVVRMGIPFIEAPFTVPARPYHKLLFRAARAAQVFKPYRFSLWHSFHYSDDYSEPIIARLAGTRNWIYTKKNMSWGSRAWRLRSRLARRIVAQNSVMFERFFPKQQHKVRLIPCGVILNPSAANGSSVELRRKWGFSSDATIVGHVAHFVPVKNHPHLLRALAQTKKNVVLVFAGEFQDSVYVSEVRTLAKELCVENRVLFLGKVRDVPSFLEALDAFAFCSHKESCPVAVLEAMAHRLPSVVTDIPAITEIHKRDQTALVVPKDDFGAFAAALDRLAVDGQRRRELGDAARRRVEENFGIEQEVSEYQRLYLDLLSEG